MTDIRPPGLLRRLPALLLASLVPVMLAVAIAGFPPILERFVLASGRAGSRPVWYVVSLLAAVAAWWCAVRALRLWRAAPALDPRRVRQALVTVAVTVAVSLLGVELLARAVLPLDKVLSGDAFSRHNWLAGRAAANSGQRLSGQRLADRYDAELGWTPIPGFRSPRLNINSGGLRGRREHPPRPGDGEMRVVITGDSFTFGENVRDDEVYTEVLDGMLDDVRVVNIAVHGYGTDQQYLRLERLGFDYEPDLVLLAHYRTNADRNVLTFRDYAKPRFRLSNGRLVLGNVPVPSPDEVRESGEPPRPRSYLWGLLRKNWHKLVAHTRFAPKWELTRAILDAAREASEQRGARFALLYIPAARPHLPPTPEPAERMLLEWAGERGVPALNLRPLFLALPEEQQERLYRGHWTPEGHRVVAEALARWIGEQDLLSPRTMTPTEIRTD